MRIWVDADACPNVAKGILFRAAERTGVELILVANHAVRVPASRFIRTIQVPHGFDVADDRIAALLERGDLVVTADVPLAAAVVRNGGYALNPRGELYTEENVRDRLAMRDLMDELRGAGVATGGPSALSKSDRQNFANRLDQILAKRLASRPTD